ncbi:antitoxin VbhA family protein [Neisseria cinerea]|uniref:antitoxin VbhA family protein n=1 Tax=Neisseria cinerea TaxID=483 RepID=UPI0028D1AADA|nr:antitoxin VbhA family protein [Neisseria cinerea]
MFLPETTKETEDRIVNLIGSWRLEGLEPSKETIRDIELIELGRLTYDEAVELAIQRAING